jgi:phosphotransacetylase
MQIPAYHKMLFMSDAAVIPFPTLEQRIAMIRYVIQLCRVYGIDQPRIALIHCTEKVSPKFPITLDYQKIVEMCQAGEFGNAIIDGPSDLKCAVDKESADIKGIKSPLEGNADAVIMPDIEAANVYYKAITAFTDTKLAVGLQGTSCPVTLTSRADSAETKYNSLAMACLQVLAE